MSLPFKGAKVYGRDGKELGFATGSTHACQMAGCRGRRVSVKWSDNKYTFPCSGGLLFDGKAWRIRS